MNPLVLLACACVLLPIAECQRQVFALIPLDSSQNFPGRPSPQKQNLAAINPAQTQDSAAVIGDTIVGNNSDNANASASALPLPLPNSVVVLNNTVTESSVATESVVTTTAAGVNPAVVPTTSAAAAGAVAPEANVSVVQNATEVTQGPIANSTVEGNATAVAENATKVDVNATAVDATGEAPKGGYVKTSATQKPCAHHTDCYPFREPDEWCPLLESERFLEKGCFCDFNRGFCTIQRLSEAGAQFSDCADKSTSSCSGLGNSITRRRQQRH